MPVLDRHRQALVGHLGALKTPLYALDGGVVRDRYARLRRALERWWPDHAIGWSFKTNYEVLRFGLPQELGALAEVVSGREYRMAREAGYEGPDIVFNGPLKRDPELRQALEEGATVHVDNASELRRLVAMAPSLEPGRRVGVRVRPEVAGLSPSRFGIPLAGGAALEAARRLAAAPNLSLVSLHVHLGTDIPRADFYRDAGQQMGALARELARQQPEPVVVETIDMGGGFPSGALPPHGQEIWGGESIDDYLEAIADGLSIHLEGLPLRLMLEPGRYLVDDAMFFVTSAVDVRAEGRFQVVLVDGATSMLPLRFYRPQIAAPFDRNFRGLEGRAVETQVHGASCIEGDILYQGHMPRVSVDDLIVFFCVGAYNQTTGAPQFIHDAPPTVLL